MMAKGHGTTVSEWHKMIDDGSTLLQRELLDGEPVTRAAMTERHADCAVRIHEQIETAIGDKALTQLHSPVVLDERSEPRPDISVIERPGLSTGTPGILLLVEVSDSSHSLIYNRGRKAAYYARSGIPECWIVDLLAEQVLVHTAPASGGYREIRNLRPGSEISLVALPDCTLAVADLLAG